MAPALLLSLFGCASPFEGTWLFLSDRQSKYSGDCEAGDTRYTGTSNSWVDIYRTTGGQFVVLYDEALVGEASGSELTAAWEAEDEDEDYSYAESISFSGELESDVMTGSVTWEVVEKSGGDTYRCEASTDFTAERAVSSPDAYPED